MGTKVTHICDRCKREFKQDKIGCGIVRIKRRLGCAVVFGLTERELRDWWGISVNKELCTDCRLKLYNFLKGGNENDA